MASKIAKKSDVKVLKSRNQITLIANYIEPTDRDLTAISQALFALLDKKVNSEGVKLPSSCLPGGVRVEVQNA